MVGGLIEPYTINIDEEEAVIPNLPEAWGEIAVIGDFQVGMWLDNTSTINRMADRLLEMKPAAVLLLGDYIYHPVNGPDAERKEVAELLEPLTKAGIPVIRVLGNHGYAMASKKKHANETAARQLAAVLEKMGIQIIINELLPLHLTETGTVIGESEEAFYITGLGASWPNHADAEQAIQGIPDTAPRIVMMHNPEAFDELEPNTAPMAVAGHTHDGQDANSI